MILNISNKLGKLKLIKTMMKCHFTAIRPANIKSLTTPSIGEYMGKQSHLQLWECVWGSNLSNTEEGHIL